MTDRHLASFIARLTDEWAEAAALSIKSTMLQSGHALACNVRYKTDNTAKSTLHRIQVESCTSTFGSECFHPLQERMCQMFTGLPVFFPHRRNKDGTFDSVCLSCSTIVGYHKTQAELDELDKKHKCRPSVIPRYHAPNLPDTPN